MAMPVYSPAWYINPGSPSSPLYSHCVTRGNRLSNHVCSTVASNYTYAETHLTVEHMLLSIGVALLIALMITLVIQWHTRKETRKAEEKARKEGTNIIWK